MSLYLHAQKMAPDGDIVQDAVDNLLTSDLQWSVFFREIFQNSNDARLASDIPIKCSFKIVSVGESAKDTIGAAMPSKLKPFGELKAFCSKKTDSIGLLISDSNTSGLDGETNPTTAVDRSNFNNFFFRLGRDPSKDDGGGAYGFGRNVLFLASELKTIFVYSKFREKTKIGRRFMGMTAVNQYSDSRSNYTGRHWWGKAGGAIQPILPFEGLEADELAAAFGLEDAIDGETGTAILVLSPTHDDPRELIRTLKTCAEVYAWPHLLPCNADEQPSCEFSFEGPGFSKHNLEIVEPNGPIRQLLTLARLGPEDRVLCSEKIEIQRARGSAFARFAIPSKEKTLGQLKYISVPQGFVGSTEEYEKCGMPIGSSVALYRNPRIIVQYLPVQSIAEGCTVFGTFEVDKTFDRLFRASENLTHDQWVPDRLKLEPGDFNPVTVAITKIKQTFAQAKAKLPSDAGGTDVQVADAIGSFISGIALSGALAGGTGSGGNPPVNLKRRRGSLRPKVQLRTRKLVSVEGDFICAEFTFTTQFPKSNEQFNIEFIPRVVLDDGFEPIGMGPKGAPQPEITSVQYAGKSETKSFIELRSNSKSEIVVMVRFPKDTVLAIEHRIVVIN